MSAAYRLLAVLALSPGLWCESPKSASPAFSTDSIVNSANGRPESLAPNTLASIYGTNLSFYTQTVTPDNVAACGRARWLARGPLGLATDQVALGLRCHHPTSYHNHPR